MLKAYLGFVLPKKGNKKFAFTLAEVLITLGVIGIVAAMTIPVLIGRWQDKVLETQVKKAQSVLANGFRKMMAKDGVSELDYINFTSCADRDCMSKEIKTSFQILNEINDDTISVPLEYKFLDGDRSVWTNNPDIVYSFVAVDGMIYGITKFDVGTSSVSIIADVNGNRKPNTGSKDLCLFTVNKGGTLKEDCAAMAKYNPLDCSPPETAWDNCAAPMYDFVFGNKKICAMCKKGYKLVKDWQMILDFGYCVPQGCEVDDPQ